MGGGSESTSTQKTDQSTKITETTNVTLGDIGISGEAITDLASVIQAGQVAQTQALAQVTAPFASMAQSIFGGSRKGQTVAFGMSAEEQREGISPVAENGVDFPLLALIAVGAFLTLRELK